jgi:hypothetical protein
VVARFVPIIVVLALVMLVVVLRVVGTDVSARDVEWIAGGVAPTSDEAEVYARYLVRHRRHRIAGGLFGLCVAVVVGIRYESTVRIGIGHGDPFADLLFCGIAGVLLGALSAESFRLSEPRSSTVSASLAEHPPAARPDLVRVARLLAGTTLLGGVLSAVTGRGPLLLSVALAGLVPAALSEATRAAIVGRRRPVLSDGARTVDTRIREFAGVSVARLQLASAVLVAAWVLAIIPGPHAAPLAAAQAVVVLGGALTAIVLLHRASPRPPRQWRGSLP